jgi:hypothetical protein
MCVCKMEIFVIPYWIGPSKIQIWIGIDTGGVLNIFLNVFSICLLGIINYTPQRDDRGIPSRDLEDC